MTTTEVIGPRTSKDAEVIDLVTDSLLAPVSFLRKKTLLFPFILLFIFLICFDEYTLVKPVRVSLQL